MPRPVELTRIVKRLLPSQRGALKLARRYGDALVCVRYRHNANGTYRYTTVELVVEEAPVLSRKTENAIVGVRIAQAEVELQRRVREKGARWDPVAKLWRMPGKLMRALGLLDRVSPM